MTPSRRKFRIVVVSPLLPVGPAHPRGRSLFETVTRFGDSVEVEAVCPITTYPSFLRPRSYSYVRPQHGFQPPGLNVTYLEYGVLPILSRPINGALCYRRLSDRLERLRPDLILNSWLYPEGYAAMQWSRQSSVPIVHYCIGSDLRRIPDPFTGLFTRRVLKNANGVIAVSSDLARLAIALGASPAVTHTVHNGVNRAQFHPMPQAEARRALGLPQDGRVILYTGDLKLSKGLADLVHSAASLKGDSVHFHLLGEGPNRQQLERLIQRLGLENRITFHGHTPNAQLPTWLAACDVFTLPSHSEGCPNVILEARACGRPIVATNVGGIPEITGPENAILVPPHHPHQLAKALNEALERQWDESAIAAGLNSWDDVACNVLQICSQVLQSS